MTENVNRLCRSRKNKVLFGVCGGIGIYFNIDPVIIRLLFIFTGIGFIAYLVMALIMPLEPQGD